MDAIRIAKVEGVLCTKAGNTATGSFHLTAYHLIFRYDEPNREEMWVPYPLISLVTRMPMTLLGKCPLSIRCRTFEIITLSFNSESDAIDVFESVKELTVATSVQQLYAFSYVPNPPFPVNNGWNIYSPREEFGRMGVGSRTKAWRFTDINKDYSFSPTYPARLVVPTRISDTTLQYAIKYRSKGRLPVLTYLHWANFGTLTRSSQPMVGLTNNRSVQDEKLIEAIFSTHHSPESRAYNGPIYGATATNLIIDARPTTNAMANTAKGAGSENMDYYKDARKAYLGIDHIHVMRESLAKVVEALRETEVPMTIGDSGETIVPVLDRQALRKSGWLRHISAILEGTALIARNVHVNSSHVLIHCSDGWDRTSQLSSLAQLCLDPFYRTVRGFQILIEKDWVSFGHKFLDRCGHLSSEKFFLAPVENHGSGGGAEAAQAFLASVQNRFASQSHVKETSPVFHQFLECVRQLQRQHPDRFEFNERFLRQVHYHLYSCQFGSFLFNTERERRVGEDGPPPIECTVSVWDFFNSPPETELNLNPTYNPSLDDPSSREPKADMGVLIPNAKDVRFWHELYGRTDEEMNGKFVVRQVAQDPEFVSPVESLEQDPALTASDDSVLLPPSPARSPLRSLQELEASTPTPSERSRSPGLQALKNDGRRIRHDSLRDSNNRSSSLPLPRSPGSSPSAVGRSSPNARSGPSDLFSRGGLRSMWGKLSSNASTAFSAVQDTYEGLAKDLQKLSVANSDDNGQGGELKSRSEINTWGQPEENQPDTPLFASHKVGASYATNPWATTAKTPAPRTRPNVPSMFLDNPWNSSSSTPESPTTAALNTTLYSTDANSLPLDPSIALPTPQPSRQTSLHYLPRDSDRQSPGILPSNAEKPVPPIPPDTSASSPPPPSSDPLGVGLL